MPYDPNIHYRRSIRLKGFDYSQPGAYFITVGTQQRMCVFGKVVNQTMCRNEAGTMIADTWEMLPQRFPALTLDAFIVMPNHLHGILVLKDLPGMVEPAEQNIVQPSGNSTRPTGTLPGTIGRILQAFKSISTHLYIEGVTQRRWQPFSGKLWERNYYEHVIRNEDALDTIRAYILENPKRWAMKPENRSFP